MFGIDFSGGSARDSLKSQWRGGGQDDKHRAATRAEYKARGDERVHSHVHRTKEHIVGRDPKRLAYERHYEDAQTFLKNNEGWIHSTRQLALAECRVELEFFARGAYASEPGRTKMMEKYTDEYFLQNYGNWIHEVHQLMLPQLLHDASDRLAKAAVEEEYSHASRSAVITSSEW